MKDPKLISSSMGKITKNFPIKFRNTTRMSSLGTVIQHIVGHPGVSNQITKTNKQKRHPNQQEGNQTSTLYK